MTFTTRGKKSGIQSDKLVGKQIVGIKIPTLYLPTLFLMKKRSSKQNFRNSIGLSQHDYAVLLRVSPSLVALEEMGIRDYPPEKGLLDITWFTAFLKMEPNFPPLDIENCLAQALTKVEPFEKDWVNKRLRNLKSQIKKNEIDNQRLNKSLATNEKNLIHAWKAIHFLEVYHPTLEDPTQKRVFKFALDISLDNLIKAAKTIHQNRADLKRLNQELTWLEEEILKCKQILGLDPKEG